MAQINAAVGTFRRAGGNNPLTGEVFYRSWSPRAATPGREVSDLVEWVDGIDEPARVIPVPDG